MIPKTIRAGQIAATIEAVAQYFGLDPRIIFTAFSPRKPDVARAQVIVWHHMHRSGLSFAAIGRIFGNLVQDTVYRRVKYGILTMSDEETLLLSTLPEIETSLEIVKP